ncbi:MAG: hypothetical protein AB7V42_00105 [Thermoleophilia bacterium]
MTNDDAAIRRRRTAQVRAKAFRMRREGASYDAIATRLGVNRSDARKLVDREMRTLAQEAEIDERRLVHVEALMDLWRSLYVPATNGDATAIDQFLRVEERISRLLGLDRPVVAGESAPKAPARRRRSARQEGEDAEGAPPADD